MSVDEYEYSALLYLSEHHMAYTDGVGKGNTADGCASADSGGQADFGGGRLVFHDEDVDRVVLPEPGLLVCFASGAPNLHAVEKVTDGQRFALTMWFTTTAIYLE